MNDEETNPIPESFQDRPAEDASRAPDEDNASFDAELLATRRAAARRLKEGLDSMNGSLEQMKAFFAASAAPSSPPQARRPEKRGEGRGRRGRMDRGAKFAPAASGSVPPAAASDPVAPVAASVPVAPAAAPASADAAATVERTTGPVLRIHELQGLPCMELVRLCDEQNLSVSLGTLVSKHDLVVALMREHLRRGGALECDGYVEIWKSEAFLHTVRGDLRTCHEDVQVPPAVIHGLRLQSGDRVVCRVSSGPGSRFVLSECLSVNGSEPGVRGLRAPFLGLDAVSPSRPISGTPYSFGERVLFLRKPGHACEKDPVELARTIATNHPEAEVWLAVLAAAPDKATALAGETAFRCVTTDFEAVAEKPLQMTGNLVEIARRAAERGRDVVLLYDSLTTLVRAFGLSATTAQGVPSDGIDGRASACAHRLLGTGRALDNGGSVTILGVVDDTPNNARILADLLPGASRVEAL